jgi:aminopeptidase-like protein
MHNFGLELFPLNRSLTGDGVRETLSRIKERLPALQIHEVPTGEAAFDWTVPDEWNVADAYVMSESGERVIDWRKNNLHLVGYSTPVDLELTLDELQPHLHSLVNLPHAIPYVTSYYQRRWGFCLSHEDRSKLVPGIYKVKIDASLAPGSLTYAEAIFPGREETEVLISTYVCHPSMANNELSGPLVATQLARWISTLPKRRFTYRFVFIPETLGAIVYLSRNLKPLKERLLAGYVLTCIGDDRSYSFLPSRQSSTFTDHLTRRTLRSLGIDFIEYPFADRGSDERQYCAPGIDLPVASVMRSKYYEFPEYHTSLDDFSLVTPSGLQGGYDAMKACLLAVEKSRRFRSTVLCEPQLGRRGLYPTLSTTDTRFLVRDIKNMWAHCDGLLDLPDLAAVAGVSSELAPELIKKLQQAGLVEEL